MGKYVRFQLYEYLTKADQKINEIQNTCTCRYLPFQSAHFPLGPIFALFDEHHLLSHSHDSANKYQIHEGKNVKIFTLNSFNPYATFRWRYFSVI